MQISTSSYRSVHQICTSDQIIMHISTSYRSAHEFCSSCRSTHHTYLHIIQHIRSFSHAHHPPKFHVLQCICFQYCKETFNLGMLNVIIHRSEQEVVEQWSIIPIKYSLPVCPSHRLIIFIQCQQGCVVAWDSCVSSGVWARRNCLGGQRWGKSGRGEWERSV